MKASNETALITGCTSGIGMHLAHQFAKHGHPLLLVAPDPGELKELKQQLAIYDVPAETIAIDLEDANSAEKVYEEVLGLGMEVDILANNAGHGFHGYWADQPIENDLSMLRLNIEAVLKLTKIFVPPMIERRRGRLLNVASIAGFEAGPTMAVYHATKAFVLSWTEALSVELEESGISVTALCPGPTDTDFFPKGGMEGTFAFQKGHLMAPQDVAEAGYEGLMDGNLIVIPGAINKAMVQGRRLLSERAQAKINQKMYREVPVDHRERERGDVETKYSDD